MSDAHVSPDSLLHEAASRRRELATLDTRPGMRDGFGRRIEYLRISVTDKCNLR